MHLNKAILTAGTCRRRFHLEFRELRKGNDAPGWSRGSVSRGDPQRPRATLSGVFRGPRTGTIKYLDMQVLPRHRPQTMEMGQAYHRFKDTWTSLGAGLFQILSVDQNTSVRKHLLQFLYQETLSFLTERDSHATVLFTLYALYNTQPKRYFAPVPVIVTPRMFLFAMLYYYGSYDPFPACRAVQNAESRCQTTRDIRPPCVCNLQGLYT